MVERKVSNNFGIVFRPALWSPLERFQTFPGEPFQHIREMCRGAKTVSDHLGKFEVLAGLVNRLAKEMHLDDAELQARGYTPAVHSKEYAAIVESLITTLYSALDGLRQTIFWGYRNVRRVQNKSNERLFRYATDKEYGEEFPGPIREALADANANWFPELRRIRTELTHNEIGHCHWDPKTDKITYLHGGLGIARRAHIIEDVPKVLTDMYSNVNGLVQSVFEFLAEQLWPSERVVICGYYRGRIYQRRVALTPDITFDSGTCESRQWFDKPEEQENKCPLRGYCGAYARVGPPPPGDSPPQPVAATTPQHPSTRNG